MKKSSLAKGGALLLGVAWFFGGGEGSVPPAAPHLEISAILGPELTEGEATSWNNSRKLAVDSRGQIHAIYQYSRSPRGQDLLRYARSEDGRTWQIEEWPGRYATLAVDDDDRAYIVYVERQPQGDRLMLRRLSPQGEWHTRILFEDSPRSIFYPALAVGPEKIHLAWESHSPTTGHTIQYLTLPLEAFFSPPTIEQIASNPKGVYFPSIALDGSGRVHVAWEAARNTSEHRIDAALRDDSRFFFEDVSALAGSGSARYPALGPGPDGEVKLVFVVYEEKRASSLYTASFELGADRWGRPQQLARYQPKDSRPGDLPDTSQKLLSFPVVEGELLVWGHVVPQGCGTGPLFWSRSGGSVPQALLGEFASYPHLMERPRGVFHLLWTDRDTQELRAFYVRYARLHF